MSKKGKNGNDLEVTTDVTADHDDDSNELPALEASVDHDDDDLAFHFDDSLIPENVKLVDLSADFVRPEGFLMVPRLNKQTGEISPMSATFVGILHDVIPWKDKRGKERYWFACEATAPTKAKFTGVDEKTQVTFVKPIEKGSRIGISSSGAINALKKKKGHFIYLHWTGNKVAVKNGDMWEVIAKVSDSPVIDV